jgi:hypothetical protein
MVTNEDGNFAKEHEERLLHHVNFEAIQLFDNSELVRKLKRKNPFEQAPQLSLKAEHSEVHHK